MTKAGKKTLKEKREKDAAQWGLTDEIALDPAAKDQDIGGPIYRTDLGVMYFGDSQKVLKGEHLKKLQKKVQLVFTSPPFPLNTKKRYGNLKGDEYIEWLANFAPLLSALLTPTGSIVIEIGNAWEEGHPVMSTVVLRALLEFLEKGDLKLCQEFIWYNPAKLPSPAQWVNVERIRVKDAFTRIWWMSKTERPKADNRRVLREYSPSMKKLIASGKYNPGTRPSQHNIGKESFKTNNNGAIPPNVFGIDDAPALAQVLDGKTPLAIAPQQLDFSSLLKASNTHSFEKYQEFCREREIATHPARMPRDLVEFFVRFLTDEGDRVLDPFGGSNTTGAVADALGRKWVSIEADWNYIIGSLGRFSPDRVKSASKSLALRKIK